MTVFLRSSCFALLALFLASAASAAEWGTITGRFVFDGTAPKPKQLKCDKDPAICCVKPHIDESILVSKDGGLANVIIYLRTKVADVHPDYAKTASDKVAMDNHECKFVPHVQGVVAGQTLVVSNSDKTGHNSNVQLLGINPLISAQGKFEQKITEDQASGVVPMEVTCNIHPWMKGYLLVRPNPYFAISDAEGNFTIKNVPAGKELEFVVWQESPGWVTDVKLAGKATKWAKGRMKMTVKPGENKLGDILVASKIFK